METISRQPFGATGHRSSRAVFGSFALNGLPEPYHPVFNTPNFAMASRDRFFLIVEATDPKFDPQATRAFLESLHPHEVTDIAH